MKNKSDNKKRIGITISPETIEKADNNLLLGNARSRSEFIEDAIKFYAGYLATEDNIDFITKAIFDTLRGIVKSSEDRVARMQFKEAVELAKISHLIAPLCEVDDEELRKLHIKCVDEVKHINGIVKLDSMIRGEV